MAVDPAIMLYQLARGYLEAYILVVLSSQYHSRCSHSTKLQMLKLLQSI